MPRKAKKQTRRGNKEGSIYQRKDGKWCGQVLTGYDDKGKPKRKTFYGSTREEVAQKVSEVTNQVFSGAFESEAPKKKLTVEKLVTDFLWIFKKPTVADVTFDWYLGIAKTHIIPILGKIKVDELTPYQIQVLINKLHGEKGLSERTVKGVRDILNQTYKHAVEMRIVEMNPVSGTKMPKRQRITGKEDEKIITVEDRVKILKATENDLRMKTAITALMFTGMRVGEFLALTWGNVNFKTGVITIDRAITHECSYNEDGSLKSRTTVIGDTKTQCSERRFKVSENVLAALKEWREALPYHMRKRPSHDVLADDAVVFPNDMGKMRTYDGFRTTYRRFMTENNLGNYTIHSCRHTFATMLLEKGVNPKVVQKLLGHRDIETTLGTYSHVLPEVYDEVATMIEEMHTEMLRGDYKPTISPQSLET